MAAFFQLEIIPLLQKNLKKKIKRSSFVLSIITTWKAGGTFMKCLQPDTLQVYL